MWVLRLNETSTILKRWGDIFIFIFHVTRFIYEKEKLFRAALSRPISGPGHPEFTGKINVLWCIHVQVRSCEQRCVCWMDWGFSFYTLQLRSLLSCFWILQQKMFSVWVKLSAKPGVQQSSGPEPPALYLHALCPRCCQMLRESWRLGFFLFSSAALAGDHVSFGDPASAWPCPHPPEKKQKNKTKLLYNWLLKSWKWQLKFGTQPLWKPSALMCKHL